MEESRKPSYSSILGFLGSTHFLIHVFSQLLPAILPVIRDELSISLMQASLLVSIPLLVQVVAYIPAGVISDRHGALVLAASFAVTALGALLVPKADGYPLLLIAFGLIALGSTLYHPPALKATSDVDPSKMSRTMGIQTAGGSLGYSAGPILLGLILPVWGWKTAFYVSIPFTLLAAVYSYFFMKKLRSTLDAPRREASYTRDAIKSLLAPYFLIVVLIGAFADATFVNLSTYITTYLTDVRGISAGLASVIFGLGPLAGILGSLGGGVAGDKLGKYRSMGIVLLFMAIMIGFIPQSPSLIVVSALYIVYRGLYSASLPLMNSLIASHSCIENRSLAFSVCFVVSNIASAFAPSVTSILVENKGISTIFPLSVISLIPSMALIIYLQRHIRGEA
jgi:FSR family fosmidomycin resistance protein-like MFS transporter